MWHLVLTVGLFVAPPHAAPHRAPRPAVSAVRAPQARVMPPGLPTGSVPATRLHDASVATSAANGHLFTVCATGHGRP
jgi:anti-sigma factor RsiW